MHKPMKVLYWNMLASPEIEAGQIKYYHEFQKEYEPDVVFLTECRTAIVSELAPQKYGLVDHSAVIKGRVGGREGIAVVSRFPAESVSITRQKSWEGKPISYWGREDARELVRVEVPFGVGRIALYGGHILHPHHLHNITLNLTRPKQWRYLRDRFLEEELSYAWLTDTNTLFRRSVNTGIEPSRTGAILLPHSGEGNQRTWKPIGPITNILRSVGINVGDTLYLDRAAVSKDLVERSSLITIPSTVNGVTSPSDHRPLLLTIAA